MATVHVRMDDELKHNAERVLGNLGVSPTQGITQLYQYIALTGRLPFRVSVVAQTPDDVYREALRLSFAVYQSLQYVAGMGGGAGKGGEELAIYSRTLVSVMLDSMAAKSFIATNIDFMVTGRAGAGNGFEESMEWSGLQGDLAMAESLLREACNKFVVQGDRLIALSQSLLKTIDILQSYLSDPTE